jgi:hypothetical protein
MSLRGKQTPLSLNVIGSLLQNSGLKVGEYLTTYVGTSTSNNSAYNYGSIIANTCLVDLMAATMLAYTKIGSITQTTYNNLISIGSTTIPALGNAKPTTYVPAYSGVDTQWGFLRMLAVQANNELLPPDSLGNYKDFVNSFIMCHNHMKTNNSVINSFVNSETFLQGTYSNMNDLTTGDITGVSVSTLYWGQDLINTGRAIDLKRIATFGNPADLLLTLQANNAFTKAISIALLAVDLTSQEILEIINSSKPATPTQQKKIYAAFKLIMGTDLNDVMIPLNCQTQGLKTLADLLNPAKLFPNSYQTLTVPKYNIIPQPTNSKTYYLIYQDGGINSQLNEYGARLRNVIPEDIAIACEAFSLSMRQIKNISKMNIEKFSQVVPNIETMKDLDVNNSSVPTDQSLATSALSMLATGSGSNGAYTMYDYYGALVGNAYPLSDIEELLKRVQTSTLASIYTNIRQLLNGSGPYSNLQTLIDSANTEIASILSSKPTDSASLNTLWSSVGTTLSNEISLRNSILGNSEDGTNSDILSFVNSLTLYAVETQEKMSADVLEKISDTSTVGGRSLIGLMRETRNAYRLSLIGGDLDNDIDDTQPTVVTNYLTVPKITGAAIPGSLGGNPNTNLIPPALDVFNMYPGAVTPSSFNPNQAIDEVTRCNCDCWDDL